MSGPKSADYYIAAAIAQRLWEQKQQALIRQENSLIVSKCSIPEAQMAQFEELARITGSSYQAEFARIRSLQQEVQVAASQKPSDLNGLRQQNQKLTELHNGIQKQIMRLEREKDSKNSELRSNIAAVFSAQRQGNRLFRSVPSENPQLAQLRERCVKELENLLLEPELSAELIQETKSALQAVKTFSKIPEMQNFYAVTVCRLQKEADAWQKMLRDYQALLTRCSVLCRQNDVPMPELPPGTEAVAKLTELAENLEQKLKQDAERAYIRSTLDDVMREMGYQVLGSRETVKRSGKAFRHKLFAYEEGTAVDVTIADDGKITMELGGLDEQDRLPENTETELLCKSMVHFCSDFAEIERRLAERGVLSRHIAALPPDPTYAQIINLHDYMLHEDADYTLLHRATRPAAHKLNKKEL